MKKRILSFVLAICLLIPGLFAFAGCNTTKPDVAVGTYQLESVQATGWESAHTKAQYEEMKNKEELSEYEQSIIFILAQLFESENSIKLYSNKTFTMSMAGESNSGEWARSEDVIVMTATVMGETRVIEATLTISKLTIVDGGMTLIYKKA